MPRDFDPTKTWGIHESELDQKKIPLENNTNWTHWFKQSDGTQICGALVQGGGSGKKYPQNRGRRCLEWRSLGANGRCRHHGRDYSGVMPVIGNKSRIKGPLRDAKERALIDKEILDLRPFLGLFDIRIEELSERLGEKCAGPEQWRSAKAHLDDFESALNIDDQKSAEYHLDALRKLFDEAVTSDRAWDKMLDTVEKRATRTEKAQDLLIKGAHMIARNDLTTILAKMMDVVIEECDAKSAERVVDRIGIEVLGRLAPAAGEETPIQEAEVLSRVPGEGAGVHGGGLGGEALGVPERGSEGGLRAREGFGEDLPRGGEDEGGGGHRADLLDDEGGLDRHHDSADGPPGSEPAVG